ncbi:MAG: GNAT family N-acetyltransferase [Paenibacillaceae bacterium]
MYKCRPVSSDDFDRICTFPRDAKEVFFMSPKLQYPLMVEHLKEATKDRRKQTVLIDENGQVSGYANIYNLEEGKLCWLGNVIISPDFRGKGAAEYLIRAMIDFAKDELNVKELHLVCHNVNTRGLMFYSKLGFKPYDIAKRTNPQGQTIAGIMMKVDL